MAMKTAESEQQKQLRKSHEAAKIAAQDAPAQTTVAPPATASEDGLKLLVQARLSVSSPNDPFEHEAESMADEFVKSMHGRTVSAPTSSAGSVARSVPDSGLVEGGGGGLATTDDTASAIMSARSGGQSLSGDVRARFEGFFGADLGGVKIHNDGTSDNLCRSINAEAFTTGSDVFFSSRNFKPGSSSGDHLLAHELTHVVQQGNAPALSRRAVPEIQRWWPFSSKKDDEPKKPTTAAEPKKEATRYLEPTEDLKENKVKTVSNLGAKGSKGGSGLFEAVETDKLASIGITDSKYAGNPEGQAKAVGDASISASSVGIAGATIALFTALYRLYNDWDKESTNSANKKLVEAVSAAILATKESTSIARTAQAAGVTGAQGLAIIGGLGIAINVIDFAVQTVKLFETSGASHEADKEIAKLTDSPTPLTVDQQKMLNALTRLSASAKREWYRSLVRAGSDLLGIAGQITILSTSASGIGPAIGAALVVAGGIGQGVVALERQVQEWMLADEVQKSRANVKAAEEALQGASAEDKGAKQEELDNAIKANLLVDDFSAARELIQAAGSLFTEDGQADDAAIKIVAEFGLNKEWLNQYVKSANKDEMLDKGAKLICDFVGKAANPMTLSQTLKGAAEKVLKCIKWVATAGYWVLKYTTKTVLMLATIPFTPLLGLWSSLTDDPNLGHKFFNWYEGAIDRGFGAIEKIGGSSEASPSATAEKPKPAAAKPQGAKNYFSSEAELEAKTKESVSLVIYSYFKEKSDRGTDIKAETVTSYLSTPYKQLVAMAKAPHADGTAPYATPSSQITTIDSAIHETIVHFIRDLAIKRVDINSVSFTNGKVAFKYVGSDKAKTKGWFAGLRGREAVED